MNPRGKGGEEQGTRGSEGRRSEAVLAASAQFAVA